MDTVCGRVTHLQQQVHHLRTVIHLNLSARLVATKQLISRTLVVNVLLHLPGVFEKLNCLLMSGSLQTFTIDSHYAIT